MKTKKIWNWLLLMAMALPMMVACGGDDDNKDNDGDYIDYGGGGGGYSSSGAWYFNGNPYRAKMISYDIEACKMFHNPLVLDEIINESISSITNCVIHIVNDNTLEVLMDDYVSQSSYGVTGKQLLYRWNSPDFGTLGFYCSYPSTYTYDYYDDNKIYVYTWSKFFTIVGNTLIEDGGRTFYSYDPNTEFVTLN